MRPKLRGLLARAGLDDLGALARADVDDEVPLFCRYKQVESLEDFGRETADRLLLLFGLDALDALTSLGSTATGMLVALTVDRFERGEPIIPRICLQNPSSAARLRGPYRLREPRTTLGRWLAREIGDLGEAGRFLVLEEARASVPGHPRVFVGHRPEFAPGLMTIDELASAPVVSRVEKLAPASPNRRAAKVSAP